MKQVRILSVAFDTEIAAHETPAFRGAVIEKVGLEHELFHNHNNDPSAKVAYHYRYPVVQYKRQGRRPSIVFIDEGVGQAQHFFMQPDWSLEFAGRRYNASISDLKVRTYDLGVTGQPHYYTLRNWAGLNQENYERFSQLESLAEQIKMLENILPATSWASPTAWGTASGGASTCLSFTSWGGASARLKGWGC